MIEKMLRGAGSVEPFGCRRFPVEEEESAPKSSERAHEGENRMASQLRWVRSQGCYTGILRWVVGFVRSVFHASPPSVARPPQQEARCFACPSHDGVAFSSGASATRLVLPNGRGVNTDRSPLHRKYTSDFACVNMAHLAILAIPFDFGHRSAPPFSSV